MGRLIVTYFGWWVTFWCYFGAFPSSFALTYTPTYKLIKIVGFLHKDKHINFVLGVSILLMALLLIEMAQIDSFITWNLLGENFPTILLRTNSWPIALRKSKYALTPIDGDCFHW
jgi:hypothetical protein